MAPWLILFVGVIYLATAADFFFHGKPAMGIVFASYALGNLGFWLAER